MKNQTKTDPASELVVCIVLGVFVVLSSIISVGICEENINVSVEIKNLTSKDLNKKFNAIDKLSRSKDKKAIKELTKLLYTEKDKRTKAKIVESLGNTNDETVIVELKRIIETEQDALIKSLAVVSLGSIGGEEAKTVLKDIVLNEKENLDVRLAAIESLSRIRDTEFVFDVLVKAIESPQPLVRKVVAGVLYHNFYQEKKDTVEKVFAKLLRDENLEVRESVESLMREIKKQ